MGNCRYNFILHNEKYNNYLGKNSRWEKDRKFCRHNLQHLLDVARIAYIINLERGLSLRKDMVYAAALLHDIGRWKQYKYGIPHDRASAELAVEILEECGYEKVEIGEILKAILSHRKEGSSQSHLEKILYESDKLSRNCFSCSASEECNWPDEMKNMNIIY